MTVTVVYLTTSSQLRLALPSHGDSNVANWEEIMAAECATKLLNWLKGSRASIRALTCLFLTSISLEIGQRPSWSGGSLPYWLEKPKVKAALCLKQQAFEPPTSMDQGGVNAPLTGIELTTIDRVVAALAN